MRIRTIWGLCGVLGVVSGLLLAGCSAGEPIAGENVNQAAEELRASAIVDVLPVFEDYYCGSVTLFNNSGSAVSAWTARIRPPTGGSVDTASGSGGTFDPPAADGSVIVHSLPGSAVIQPYATKAAAFTICVERIDSSKFTVTNVTASSCPTYYPDTDHDGFGDATQPLSTCTQPADYVANSTDCCDADARVFPGQTAYYSTVSACGSYDFNCNGTATAQSNGPTGCFEAPLTCTLSGSTCIASAPPAGCNNEFRSNNTASCGQPWITSVKGCFYACTQVGCFCSQWSNGGPGGTGAQKCQ